MMQIKVDYVIFYEHVTRELESVERVKLYLDSMGYKGVILPIHYNRYFNVLRFKPKVVVVPYLYSKHNSTYMRYKKLYKGVQCLNLHSEQISNENTVDFLLPSDDYSRGVYHISWGDKFAKELKQIGIEKSKIFITGSIRNDSIIDHKKEIEDISNNILVPTSFSLTMVSEEYIENLTQAMDRKKLDRNIEFMRKSRDAFFKIIYKLSQKLSLKNFHLRPHPHVDIDIYKQIFMEINQISKIPSNIIIERKGSIQKFFSKGDKIIAWHSTSILEGSMMKKDVAILAPIEFPKHMYMDFMDYIKILKTEKDIFNFIANKNKKESLLDNYIYNNFYKIDGLSSLRVAGVIASIIEEKKEEVQIKSKIYFCLLLLNFLIKDTFKNILLKLNVLDKLNKNYKGIIEDCVEISKRQNKKCFNKKINFKKKKNGIYVDII